MEYIAMPNAMKEQYDTNYVHVYNYELHITDQGGNSQRFQDSHDIVMNLKLPKELIDSMVELYLHDNISNRNFLPNSDVKLISVDYVASYDRNIGGS